MAADASVKTTPQFASWRYLHVCTELCKCDGCLNDENDITCKNDFDVLCGDDSDDNDLDDIQQVLLS